MKNVAIFASLGVALTAGCASNPDTQEGQLFTWVSSIEYAERICKTVELDDYATCVNRMLAVYQDPNPIEFPPEQGTSGPFMATLNGQNYYGWYRSQPFKADFRASNGRTTCRGGYNAFVGDTAAIFDVRCDDGRTGTADMVLDESGRNGIGTITLSDGRTGDLVFGRDALQGTPAAG